MTSTRVESRHEPPELATDVLRAGGRLTPLARLAQEDGAGEGARHGERDRESDPGACRQRPGERDGAGDERSNGHDRVVAEQYPQERGRSEKRGHVP